jgi:hypothetical protein
MLRMKVITFKLSMKSIMISGVLKFMINDKIDDSIVSKGLNIIDYIVLFNSNIIIKHIMKFMINPSEMLSGVNVTQVVAGLVVTGLVVEGLLVEVVVEDVVEVVEGVVAVVIPMHVEVRKGGDGGVVAEVHC